MITAQGIKNILAERFSSSNGFAFFPEFRTMTGYNPAGYIDAVAVGQWRKNCGIWAFEIKVSRGDFAQDVSQFQHKHEQALEISHRFFYVCPWGLIDKNEVPDITGLMWINKSGILVTKKHAQLRVKDEIPMIYFQAFAREFGRIIDHSKIPVQFLGQELSQADFMKIVEKKKEALFDADVKTAAWKLIEERKNQNGVLRKKLKDIKGILRCWNDEEILPQLEEYVRRATCFDGISQSMAKLSRHVENAEKIIEGSYGGGK